MADSLPPEAFLDILAFLNTKGIKAEVVAGQAANIWARIYVPWDRAHSPLRPSLSELEPFASRDMEILSGTRSAMKENPALLTEDAAGDPFGHAWSPDEATWYFTSEEHGVLKVQSMRAILGLETGEIRKRLLPMTKDGVNFLVPDPLVLLKGKIANLDGLDQHGRNDLKHAKMLIRCVRAFIGEDVQKGVPGRDVMKTITRLAELLRDLTTHKVAQKYGLDFSDALPVDILAQSHDPKLVRFMNEGLPRTKVFHPNPEIQQAGASAVETAKALGVTPQEDEVRGEVPSIGPTLDKIKKLEEEGFGLGPSPEAPRM